MRFIKYSRFSGFDVFSVDLGDLMDALSNSLLDSGYSDDYWWMLERARPDDSIDDLRESILDALLEKGVLSEYDVEKMLAENEGKFRGSLLEELINKLIERLVEEGYLDLKEVSRNEDGEFDYEDGESDDDEGLGEIGDRRQRNIKFEVTDKGLDFLGYKTLQELFGATGRSSIGRHETPHLDTGVEAALSSKQYEFGDTINLDVNATLMSAIAREGLGVPLNLEYKDLFVRQQDHSSSCATVVMLDCSHSMILYGEDRFTPAKKVAIALAHLIRTQYPGDSLKVVLFHDYAEELPISRLATTRVGPYHTNTAAGLKLARRILNSQRKEMRQIVMITDGKPTAVFIEHTRPEYPEHLRRNDPPKNTHPLLYRDSMGRDPLIIGETFKEIQACRKAGIMINTFMLARDYHLVEFVKKMTAMTHGKAYFADPDNLTEFVLMDFLNRRTTHVR